jgi:hypothetical protein
MPVASLDEMQFLLAAIAYLFMGESATGPAST